MKFDHFSEPYAIKAPYNGVTKIENQIYNLAYFSSGNSPVSGVRTFPKIKE